MNESNKEKIENKDSADRVIKIEPIQEAPLEARTVKKRGILTQEIGIFPPNIRDMAIFCRQLSTLLDVGIPLVRSLRILSERTHHPRLQKVIHQVTEKVEEGQSLSTALSAFPKVFSPLFIGVVRVGELGGILDSSLKRLADILERKADIKKKIISSLAYPIVSFCVAIGVIVVILTVAIPRFEEVYKSQEVALPGITQVVLAISNFVRSYPFVYVPIILAIIVLLLLWSRTPAGKWTFDFLKLRLPVMGPINTKINVARFTRTTGNLLSAGIPLLEALNLAASTSENMLIADALRKTYKSVEEGGKIDAPLRENPVFPELVVDMIAIGDEAGSLDVMLNKIADFYETDVEASLRGLTAIIEPIFIIFMGFVVIFIALAVLLPYFNLVHVVGMEE
ncbi:type II secretion system F family protein [Candidatus Sumerlaeota bacterium]|nr:type II secretion system F family protein [Candidatus Sumerlaeota bacterium]